jgi:hypothetical protein
LQLAGRPYYRGSQGHQQKLTKLAKSATISSNWGSFEAVRVDITTCDGVIANESMCVSGDLFLATKVLITIQSLFIRKLCKYLAAVTQLVVRSAFTSPSVGPGEQFRSKLGTGLIKLSAVEQTIMHTTQQQRSTRLLLPLEFLIHSSPAEYSDPSLLFFPILLSEPTASFSNPTYLYDGAGGVVLVLVGRKLFLVQSP